MKKNTLVLFMLCSYLLSACSLGNDFSNTIPEGHGRISSVRILDFPSIKPDGSAWDALGGAPDLYVNIESALGETLFSSKDDSVYINIGKSDLPLGIPLRRCDIPLNALFYIVLYDRDTGADEKMCLAGPYTLSEFADDRPSSLPFGNATNFAGDMYFRWN